MSLSLSAAWARALAGCPLCFGDPSSDMVKGAKAGVVFLLLVVAGLLVTIAAIARSWALRARALERAAGASGHQMPAKSPGTTSDALPSLTSSNA